MNERLKQILIGTGMILLLTFLLFKTNAVDSIDHLRYSTDLRLAKEIDSTLDRNLLELRFGTVLSDEELKASILKLDALQDDLREIPVFLDIVSKSKHSQLVKEFDNASNEKEAAIKRFIDNNLKMTAALKDFDSLVTEFNDKSAIETGNIRYSENIDLVAQMINDYTYSSRDNFKEGLEKSMMALRTQRIGEKSVEISTKLDQLLAFASIILEEKPERDSLIKYILGIPTGQKINESINFYQSEHFEAVNLTSIYRLILYVFTIILLAYGFHVLLKLKRTSQALNLVNENLEARVDERTNDLLLINIDLQQSESDNRALLGALPDTIWRINGVGVFLDMIAGDIEPKHETNDGWNGKTIFDVLPEDQAEQALVLTKKALETNELQKFEFNLTKNKKKRHYESRMVVCGSFEVLVIVRDITELKQAQAEAHLISEIVQGANKTSNLGELLELIHQLISRMIYAENCFVALYDEETDSLDFQLFVDKFDPAPQKEKLGKGLTAYVVRSGESVILTNSMIKDLAAKGDIELIGPTSACWVGIPLKTPEGIIGALVVQHYEDENAYGQRDVELLTSIGDQIALAIMRKQAENSLRVSEVRFQQAFDYAPIGICLTSIEGKFLQVNRALCEMLGYGKDDLLKLSLIEVADGGHMAISMEKQRQLVAGEINSVQIEKRFLHESGATVLSFTSVSLVKDFRGLPKYFIWQIQDVSEQKNMEDQLQRAQKLESIGQLAAGIAHEINTPTQYVGDNTRFLSDSFEGYASVLEMNSRLLEACKTDSVTAVLVSEMEKTIEDADIEYLSEEIPVAIKQALHGVERISKIVQSMKEFAHPGSVDKKAADLNRAIESTITVASNEWKYVADLKTEFDPNLPALPCLVGEFNQVILNMIINASHAIADVVGDGSNGKGTITITTTKVNDWAQIRIGDTGTGIPEEIRKKIFDPFFTTKVVGRGSGQGLAISHNVIVEKHNGKIEVESEVGKGTTFVISLPLIECERLSN